MTNSDYLYDKNINKGYYSNNFFVDGKLGFKLINHGTIIPHIKEDNRPQGYYGTCGVVDSQGNFYKEIDTMKDIKPEKLHGTVIKNPDTVVYLGLLAPTWGHDITFNLRRLWFLNSAAFRAEFKNCRFVYTPWYKKGWGDEYHFIKQKPNFPRILEILDIDPNSLQPVTQPMQFENVILPDASFYFTSGNMFSFTEEYRETIDRIRNFAIKNRTPTSSNKIYYFYGKYQIGEERMASYFRTKGYLTISPEKFSFDEQLNLMINCDSFASTLGSCSHNSIFLRDGSEVILIPRAANSFTFYQQTLEQLHPLNTTYIDSSLSIFGTLHKSYCFIISKQLKSFFGDKFYGYTQGDFEIFAKYLKSQGGIINPKAQKYYRRILPSFLAQFKRREDLIAKYNLPADWDKKLL